MMPKIKAAYADCTGSGEKAQFHFDKITKALKTGKPKDLPTCISDIEGIIPDLQKVIADFKAGNYE
jgi:hypothetical protein